MENKKIHKMNRDFFPKLRCPCRQGTAECSGCYEQMHYHSEAAKISSATTLVSSQLPPLLNVPYIEEHVQHDCDCPAFFGLDNVEDSG